VFLEKREREVEHGGGRRGELVKGETLRLRMSSPPSSLFLWIFTRSGVRRSAFQLSNYSSFFFPPPLSSFYTWTCACAMDLYLQSIAFGRTEGARGRERDELQIIALFFLIVYSSLARHGSPLFPVKIKYQYLSLSLYRYPFLTRDLY